MTFAILLYLWTGIELCAVGAQIREKKKIPPPGWWVDFISILLWPIFLIIGFLK